MDEEEFETIYFETSETPARRFRRADIFVLGMGLIQGFASAVHETATTAYNLVAMHANYECERDDFMEQAALDIETITNGEELG